MANEQWKPVPGWVGIYEVSDLGRIRSLPRVVNRRDGVQQKVPGRVLAASPGTDGYPRVKFSREGIPAYHMVHRLVLAAFVGPPPAGHEALHANGVRADARLSNLRWGTSSENKADVVLHGRHPQARRTHCPQGHPYDAVNTYLLAGGRRNCRTCRNAQNRVVKARSRARALAAASSV